jgi:hypothetical protein
LCEIRVSGSLGAAPDFGKKKMGKGFYKWGDRMSGLKTTRQNNFARLGLLACLAATLAGCSHFQPRAISVRPDFGGCGCASVQEPALDPSDDQAANISAPTFLSLSCHNEWMRLFASVEWKTTEREDGVFWSPQISYGPDLTFGIKDGSAEVKHVITIPSLKKVKLMWETKPRAAYCVSGGEWAGKKEASGEAFVKPSHDGVSTYTIECFGDNGVKSTSMALISVKAKR